MYMNFTKDTNVVIQNNVSLETIYKNKIDVQNMTFRAFNNSIAFDSQN